MLELKGSHVALRPFHPEELDAVIAGLATSSVGPADSPNRRRLARRLAASGSFVNGQIEFAIDAGWRLVGDVQARAPDRAFPPGVYELGITIYDPADRGKGYGREAISLLVDHLFDAMGAERIQAGTALWNEPARRMLAALGFREEGVMRAFMPADGSRDDYVLTALTRADRPG